MVSVRLMTYNHEKFIEDALNGIDIQQTSFLFEVVVGDDFSTDKTLEKIKNFQFSNPNLNLKILNREFGDAYYKIRKKKGRLYNFVDILNKCTGKYIALLDGDDFWTDPLKLQKQVDFLEGNEEFGICFHNVTILEQEVGKKIPDYVTREVPEETNADDLAKGNFIHTPSVLLKNNFELPKWFAAAAMGDWTLYMIQIKNQKIKKLDDEMAIYRIHSGGIWGNKSQEKRNALTQGTIKLIQKNAALNPSVRKILQSRIGTVKKNNGKFYFKSFFRKLKLLM